MSPLTRRRGGSRRGIARTIAVAALIILGIGSGLYPASASPDRVSRGEAVAVFNAFGTGRLALLAHDVGHGAPADGEGMASIRPIPEVFMGRHFCAEDWHVLSVATIDGGDKSYTMQDAKAVLDATTVTLVLGGVPLTTQRTPIKRLIFPQVFFPDLEEAYLINDGVIVSPAALAVGAHTLAYVRTSPGEIESEQITFFIDAPGTGVCL